MYTIREVGDDNYDNDVDLSIGNSDWDDDGLDINRRKGRLSSFLNEDDFDYALELRPDDEYRLVAEKLPQILDFEELDLNDPKYAPHSPSLVSETKPSSPLKFARPAMKKQKSMVESISEFTKVGRTYIRSFFYPQAASGNSDVEMGLKTSPSKRPNLTITIPEDDIISESDFRSQMGLLKTQKLWVESARRRSSMSYMSKFMISDKTVHDKFLVFLFNGIHVRRHQAFHISEMIRLSSRDGGKTVIWTKSNPVELITQRRKEGVNIEGSTKAVYAAAHDSNGFDYCIRCKKNFF